MDAHHTIVDFATAAVVLPTDTHGMPAALGRARLVDAADRFRVRMIFDDDLLTAISEFFFIPLDRFEKTLQGPRCGLELQCDGFGRLAVQIRQLPLDIDSQQCPCLAPSEAIGEQRQKQTQLPSQGRNLL